ncbi:MAG: DUF3139 domain-containing protein [Oscillospiraceae bacterium]|nr:DUF3139 domain-containing protein [Oscillospiraceae bacterium]
MFKESDHKAVFKGLVIVLCAAALLLIYYFPLQRVLAERKLDEYLALQGADPADIESIEYHKDYKQDGYSVFVSFADSEYRYVYRYYLFSTGQGDGLRFDLMYCDVYNSENTYMDGFAEGMKYKSLEWAE